jgi:hypothetical protein
MVKENDLRINFIKLILNLAYYIMYKNNMQGIKHKIK